jgi:hypothetical protein
MSEIIEDKKVEEKEVKKPTTKAKTTKPKAKEKIDKLTQTTAKPEIKKQRDMNEMINVICITNTPLVYVSKNQMGYRVDWEGYLAENWMEYKELVNMRNSQRSFFTEPWIICDWDVLEDLKVEQYYKNIIDLKNLDDIFKKEPEELEEILNIVPRGIKTLIVDRAFELRKDKKLDSISVVETIEKTLNVDLSL